MDLEALVKDLNNLASSDEEKAMQRERLSQGINDLLVNDFSKLVQLLYRVDVSEKLLKETLKNNPTSDAGDLMADLILQRLEEKAVARRNQRTSTDVSDEERW